MFEHGVTIHSLRGGGASVAGDPDGGSRSRELRQAVFDLVVITLVGNEYVGFASHARRLVEGPGENGNLVKRIVLPEQNRSATATESTSGLIRGRVPGDGLGAVNLYVGIGDAGGGEKMAGLFATLGAVAIDHATQRPPRGETDGAAKTRAVMQSNHARPRVNHAKFGLGGIWQDSRCLEQIFATLHERPASPCRLERSAHENPLELMKL